MPFQGAGGGGQNLANSWLKSVVLKNKVFLNFDFTIFTMLTLFTLLLRPTLFKLYILFTV